MKCGSISSLFIGKETKDLAIDQSSITPNVLCECGNETISFLLNTNSEKAGNVCFYV